MKSGNVYKMHEKYWKTEHTTCCKMPRTAYRMHMLLYSVTFAATHYYTCLIHVDIIKICPPAFCTTHPFTQPPKSCALQIQCFSISQTPQKWPFLWRNLHPQVIYVPWTNPTNRHSIHYDNIFKLAATLRGSRPGVQSASPKIPKNTCFFRGHQAPRGRTAPIF